MPKIQLRVGNKIINIMSFFEAVKTCLVEKYFTFSGRATRSEFWWFHLFTSLLIYGSVFLGIWMYPNNPEIVFGICGVVMLLLIIPNLSVTVRRLHDVGKSGWFFLICLIPYIGAFILLIKYLTPSIPELLDTTE